MGVIQQGINQFLGLGTAVAAGTKHFLQGDVEKKENLSDALDKHLESVTKETYELSKGTTHEEKAKEDYELSQISSERQNVDKLEREMIGDNLIDLSKRGKTAKSYIKQTKNEINKNLKLRGEIANERARNKGREQLEQKEGLSNFKKQISSDVQDTINIMKGKDVPTQAELDLDKKILKVLPNFNDFSESARQQIREQFKRGGNK